MMRGKMDRVRIADLFAAKAALAKMVRGADPTSLICMLERKRMSNIYDLFKSAANDIRYFLTFGSILILSLLLLFMDKLPIKMKEHFVPSLVVFIIGTAFLAALQAMVGVRHQNKSQNDLLPGWVFWLFISANIIWIVAFVRFNLCRGSL
jgi:hypothetical protein